MSADESHFVLPSLCPFLVKPRALTRRKLTDKGIPDFSLWLWCRCLITQCNPIDVRGHQFWSPFQTGPYKRDGAYFKTSTRKPWGHLRHVTTTPPITLLLYYQECLFSCWKQQSSYATYSTNFDPHTDVCTSCYSSHMYVCRCVRVYHSLLSVSRCATLCMTWHIKTQTGRQVICTIHTTWPFLIAWFNCCIPLLMWVLCLMWESVSCRAKR